MRKGSLKPSAGLIGSKEVKLGRSRKDNPGKEVNFLKFLELPAIILPEYSVAKIKYKGI